MSEETRRSFIKSSLAKAIVATNAVVVAGLINTPGSADAGGGGTTYTTTNPNPRNYVYEYSDTSEATGTTAEAATASAENICDGIKANTTSLATNRNEKGPFDAGAGSGSTPKVVWGNTASSEGAIYSLWDNLYHVKIKIKSSMFITHVAGPGPQ